MKNLPMRQTRAATAIVAVLGCALLAALARQIVTTVREAVRDTSPPRIHLLLSTPLALALVLGHIWNRMPDTTVYEDLLSER